MRLVADWLQRPALVALIDALSTDGPAPRLVGGCVRDGLLGRSVADIDLATPLPPEAVIVALESADIRVVPTGIDHGTVTAVIDGVGYEVTTLRRDVATDGRRAVVAFTDDWRGDAARRDFTMNAMSSEPDGTLHDYFGGAADARNGVVRFVGDPATRIAEDYLRVPRFFRFMAWYGRSAPPEDVMRAISASIPKLDGLVAERVRAELLRWLGAPDPRWSWDLAESAGLAIWLFGDVDTARFNRLVGREIDRGLPAESLRRLAALALPPGPGSTETANRFRLSRAEARYLAALEAAVPAARQALTADDARRLAYRSGPAVARDALLLVAGDEDLAKIGTEGLESWTVPDFPLSGSDAEALGLSRGPEIGKALRTVEDWWLAHDFQPDRAACLARLAVIVEGAGHSGGS